MFFKASLRQLYREDQRPWLVGFSGGKDGTLLASLIFDAVLSIPAEQVRRPLYHILSDVIAAPLTVYCLPSTVLTSLDGATHLTDILPVKALKHESAE